MFHLSRFRMVGLGAVVLLSAASCGLPDAGSGAEDGSRTLTVFAAASLQSTFTTLAEEFEAANPGMDVTLSFAGSSDLATQLSAGAPADVFAAADTSTMDRVASEGLLDGEPVDFATNTLMIAVPPGNPANIDEFSDLEDPGVKVVRCAQQVPCGAAAVRAEEATGISVNAVSEEASVTDTLGKVRSGEADAGLVYVTDVLAAGSEVEGIAFPEAQRGVTTYPLAVVAGGNIDPAQDFLDLVTGPVGAKVLSEAGFGSP